MTLSTNEAKDFDPVVENPAAYHRAAADAAERIAKARDAAVDAEPAGPENTAERGTDQLSTGWDDEPAEDAGETMELVVPASDVENSTQFAKVHAGRVKYCHELRTWLLWEGDGWRRDRQGGIIELAKEYARRIESSCLGIDDAKSRLEHLKKSIAFAQAGRLESMLDLSKSDPLLVAPVDRLDADPLLAGVGGGHIDLRTGAFSPPDPGMLLTKRLGTRFDPSAGCPVWESFLARVIPDADLRRFLQASVGYTLTGITCEHIFWFLHGSGSNGKTTFVETLQALMGDYGQSAPESLIAVHLHGKQPNAELARLPGVRFLSGSEVSQGMKLNEGLIKGLTGEDTMTGEAKYCAPFNFKPALKLWLFGNHRPSITGTDGGIWRRVRLIPFTQEIPDSEKDKSLTSKLRAELPGILNWALAGLRDWRENGFVLPEVVSRATADYRSDSDVIGGFIGDHVEEACGCSLPAKDVYAKYREWCREEGLDYPLSAIAFNNRLSDRGFNLVRSNGQRKWMNLGWLPEN